MAITTIASLTGATAVAVHADSDFVTTGSFVVYADGFAGNSEEATLYRLGPSGTYIPATNKDGIIKIKDYPNMVLVDCPGTFRVAKTASAATVTIGYEEV